MDEETSDLTAGPRHFVLATSEYLSVSDPRHKLIRAELMEGKVVTLCLFCVDILYISTQYAGNSEEEVKQYIRDSVGEAITGLVTGDNFEPSKIYYGTHLPDGSFEISDQKPSWEDGNWGTKFE